VYANGESGKQVDMLNTAKKTWLF